MNIKSLRRRRLITALTAGSILPLHQLVLAQGNLLPVTPSDAEGPFYPVQMPPDTDNDLLHVASRDNIAPGQLAYVRGRVTDPEGNVIDGARVEIWQCDHAGVYDHPEDPGSFDQSFQGFGAMVTSRDGDYHFRTMRPVPYGQRTPHIHFKVKAKEFKTLTTQLYVREESVRNSADFLYKRHSKAEQQLLTSVFTPLTDKKAGPVTAEFNIVLG